MKQSKVAKTVCLIAFVVAMMGAVLAPGARADEWNKKTVFTFSGPVEIPGVHLKGFAVLPAGTYVFKILDSQSDRHIVQIFSADEKTVYATILAIPNYRLKVTGKTVMTFRERPAGEPEALRAWFYPGSNSGEEFVYGKARATELAKAEGAPVLYTEAAIPVEAAEPSQSANAAVVVQMQQAPVMAIQPSGEPVEMAQVVTPPPPAELQVTQETLPATASTLPLIALFGLMALFGAFAVRASAKRLQ